MKCPKCAQKLCVTNTGTLYYCTHCNFKSDNVKMLCDETAKLLDMEAQRKEVMEQLIKLGEAAIELEAAIKEQKQIIGRINY